MSEAVAKLEKNKLPSLFGTGPERHTFEYLAPHVSQISNRVFGLNDIDYCVGWILSPPFVCKYLAVLWINVPGDGEGGVEQCYGPNY